MMINSSLGFVMFFIRSCETNFYSVLDCNCFRNYNENESNEENNAERNKKKTLISMISSNMNLEFMCCILYGLTEIFYKKKARKNKMRITNNEDNRLDKRDTICNIVGFDSKIIEEMKSEKENDLDEVMNNHIITNDLSENFLVEDTVDKKILITEDTDLDTMNEVSRKKTEYIKAKRLNLFKSDEIKLSSNQISANNLRMKMMPSMFRNKSINYKKPKRVKAIKNKKVVQLPNLNIQVKDELNRKDDLKSNLNQEENTFVK